MQCGEESNINQLRGVANELLAQAPYVEHFNDWHAPWNYAAPAITEERLLAAGFAEAHCWLTPAPTEPEYPREFLQTIVLVVTREHSPSRCASPSWTTCGRFR